MTDSISDLPKLPKRPSTLIRLACDDAEKIYRAPGYTLNMNMWHENVISEGGKSTCAVCFAGAVIANTLGQDRGVYTSPARFASDHQALKALNYFRRGEWVVGLGTLLGRGLTAVERLKLAGSGVLSGDEIPQPRAGSKGVAFIRAMRKCAKALESVGW